MTAALATAFFLFIAWLVVVAVAATFEGRLRQVRSALAGRSNAPVPQVSARYALRYPLRRPQRAVMRPRLRAAA